MRMWEEIMAKRADRLREQGRTKRGRPWLRWADCVRMESASLGWLENGESWLMTKGSGEVEWSRHGSVMSHTKTSIK